MHGEQMAIVRKRFFVRDNQGENIEAYDNVLGAMVGDWRDLLAAAAIG